MVDVVDVLEDQARGSAVGVPDDVEELDDVWAAAQVLQDLDFSLDLLLLHGLQDLDDTPLLVVDVDALEHLTVLATADLANDLVVLLVPAQRWKGGRVAASTKRLETPAPQSGKVEGT